MEAGIITGSARRLVQTRWKPSLSSTTAKQRAIGAEPRRPAGEGARIIARKTEHPRGLTGAVFHVSPGLSRAPEPNQNHAGAGGQVICRDSMHDDPR
ncbi:unnamed protein product [Lota lota]